MFKIKNFLEFISLIVSKILQKLLEVHRIVPVHVLNKLPVDFKGENLNQKNLRLIKKL